MVLNELYLRVRFSLVGARDILSLREGMSASRSEMSDGRKTDCGY